MSSCLGKRADSDRRDFAGFNPARVWQISGALQRCIRFSKNRGWPTPWPSRAARRRSDFRVSLSKAPTNSNVSFSSARPQVESRSRRCVPGLHRLGGANRRTVRRSPSRPDFGNRWHSLADYPPAVGVLAAGIARASSHNGLCRHATRPNDSRNSLAITTLPFDAVSRVT
jgi:hypothetical protein